MVTYESIYPGSNNFLLPKYNAVGYTNSAGYGVRTGDFSISLDPRTANQIKEVNTKLNVGAKNVEIQGLMPKNWEAIPDEHLTEMKRLTTLIGARPSLHAPLIEVSGVGERGWDEVNRIAAEKELESAILRANKLDSEGNINVTVHSTAQLPEMIQRSIVDGEPKTKTVWVIDKDSGKFGAIEPQTRYFPEDGKFNPEEEKEFNTKTELKKLNEDKWTDQLSSVNRLSSYGEEILSKAKKVIPDLEIIEHLIKEDDINYIKTLDPEIQDIAKSTAKEFNHGQIYLRDAYRQMKDLFDKTYKNASEDDQKKLKTFAEQIKDKIKPGIETDIKKTEEFEEVIEQGLKTLRDIKTPQYYAPLNEFVIDKSSETFANVATSAFKQFGQKAPVISIENPPAGSGLSRADDLKKLVEESRNKLAENLKKKGLGEDEAKATAEKLIGATWDVGHINMIRKAGYSEKDVIEETKKIAPFVKHVHLSDNFGFEHTELPMGMGNVPTKEILSELSKKGFKGKEVIEAGDWMQHFADQGGGHPFAPSLRGFDSPIYPVYQSPSWSQLGNYMPYYSGHGPVNPSIHHQIYGSGFNSLPVELGGEMPGSDRGRLASS
jgi:hypothetical protein